MFHIGKISMFFEKKETLFAFGLPFSSSLFDSEFNQKENNDSLFVCLCFLIFQKITEFSFTFIYGCDGNLTFV